MRFYYRTGPQWGVSVGPVGALAVGIFWLMVIAWLVEVAIFVVAFVAVVTVALLIAAAIHNSGDYRCDKHGHKLDRARRTCPIDGSPVMSREQRAARDAERDAGHRRALDFRAARNEGLA